MAKARGRRLSGACPDNLAVGGSCVLNPVGVYLAEPVFEIEPAQVLDYAEQALAAACSPQQGD
jgi:hypothetical protein